MFGRPSNVIKLCLQCLDVPSAHAWRSGIAIRALRAGVSETSVKNATGWSSGAMVSRYTSDLVASWSFKSFITGGQLSKETLSN